MIVLVFLLLLLFVEVFAYKGIQFLLQKKNKSTKTIVNVLYWAWTVIVTGLIIYTVINREEISIPKNMDPAFKVITLGLMNFISKFVLASFHFLNETTVFAYNKMKKPETTGGKPMSRSKFLTTTGLALASIPFGGFLYGMAIGRFNFRILKHAIKINNLPNAFEGMRIVHISDMHLGSFPQHTNAIAKAVEMVNSLNADYILFTGDMINERAIEAEHWIDTVAKMKAKYGKYSTLGNHDYGSYYGPWSGKPDKIEQNIQHLAEIQEKMGFQMLRNENLKLEHNGESIRLIGLENWGVGFVQSGDLNKAMQGVASNEVKILMSHDPSHWSEEVIGKTTIDLALAGHTHGFQMGIEIPALNIKWSPVSLRYKHWGGLYQEGEQQLYVNRGFGYHAFAGRIGMNPEITLLTLEGK